MPYGTTIGATCRPYGALGTWFSTTRYKYSAPKSVVALNGLHLQGGVHLSPVGAHLRGGHQHVPFRIAICLPSHLPRGEGNTVDLSMSERASLLVSAPEERHICRIYGPYPCSASPVGTASYRNMPSLRDSILKSTVLPLGLRR